MSSELNTTRVAVIGMGPSGIAATIGFIKYAEKPNKTTSTTDDSKENSKKKENIEYVSFV